MLTRNLISSALMFLIISCGSSSETGSEVASIDLQKQNQSIMVVLKESGEFCKAPNENSSLVSNELLKPTQDVPKFTEDIQMEQKIMQLSSFNLNEMSNCDQETLNVMKQITSKESLTAGLAVTIVAGSALAATMLCEIGKFLINDSESANKDQSSFPICNVVGIITGGAAAIGVSSF